MRGIVFPLLLGVAALGLVGLTPADAQARGRRGCSYSGYSYCSPSYYPAYGGYYGGFGGYCYPSYYSSGYYPVSGYCYPSYYSSGYYPFGGYYYPSYYTVGAYARTGYYRRGIYGRRVVRSYPRPTPYSYRR
jgi:hypothetical protein